MRNSVLRNSVLYRAATLFVSGALTLCAMGFVTAFVNAPSSFAAVSKTNHGGVISDFGLGIDTPVNITSGPDGALWFTNYVNNSIGRITTAGAVTEYTGSRDRRSVRHNGGS